MPRQKIVVVQQHPAASIDAAAAAASIKNHPGRIPQRRLHVYIFRRLLLHEMIYNPGLFGPGLLDLPFHLFPTDFFSKDDECMPKDGGGGGRMKTPQIPIIP